MTLLKKITFISILCFLFFLPGRAFAEDISPELLAPEPTALDSALSVDLVDQFTNEEDSATVYDFYGEDLSLFAEDIAFDSCSIDGLPVFGETGVPVDQVVDRSLEGPLAPLAPVAENSILSDPLLLEEEGTSDVSEALIEEQTDDTLLLQDEILEEGEACIAAKQEATEIVVQEEAAAIAEDRKNFASDFIESETDLLETVATSEETYVEEAASKEAKEIEEEYQATLIFLEQALAKEIIGQERYEAEAARLEDRYQEAKTYISETSAAATEDLQQTAEEDLERIEAAHQDYLAVVEEDYQKMIENADEVALAESYTAALENDQDLAAMSAIAGEVLTEEMDLSGEELEAVGDLVEDRKRAVGEHQGGKKPSFTFGAVPITPKAEKVQRQGVQHAVNAAKGTSRGVDPGLAAYASSVYSAQASRPAFLSQAARALQIRQQRIEQIKKEGQEVKKLIKRITKNGRLGKMSNEEFKRWLKKQDLSPGQTALLRARRISAQFVTYKAEHASLERSNRRVENELMTVNQLLAEKRSALKKQLAIFEQQRRGTNFDSGTTQFVSLINEDSRLHANINKISQQYKNAADCAPRCTQREINVAREKRAKLVWLENLTTRKQKTIGQLNAQITRLSKKQDKLSGKKERLDGKLKNSFSRFGSLRKSLGSINRSVKKLGENNKIPRVFQKQARKSYNKTVAKTKSFMDRRPGGTDPRNRPTMIVHNSRSPFATPSLSLDKARAEGALMKMRFDTLNGGSGAAQSLARNTSSFTRFADNTERRILASAGRQNRKGARRDAQALEAQARREKQATAAGMAAGVALLALPPGVGAAAKGTSAGAKVVGAASKFKGAVNPFRVLNKVKVPRRLPRGKTPKALPAGDALADVARTRGGGAASDATQTWVDDLASSTAPLASRTTYRASSETSRGLAKKLGAIGPKRVKTDGRVIYQSVGVPGRSYAKTKAAREAYLNYHIGETVTNTLSHTLGRQATKKDLLELAGKMGLDVRSSDTVTALRVLIGNAALNSDTVLTNVGRRELLKSLGVQGYSSWTKPVLNREITKNLEKQAAIHADEMNTVLRAVSQGRVAADDVVREGGEQIVVASENLGTAVSTAGRSTPYGFGAKSKLDAIKAAAANTVRVRRGQPMNTAVSAGQEIVVLNKSGKELVRLGDNGRWLPVPSSGARVFRPNGVTDVAIRTNYTRAIPRRDLVPYQPAGRNWGPVLTAVGVGTLGALAYGVAFDDDYEDDSDSGKKGSGKDKNKGQNNQGSGNGSQGGGPGGGASAAGGAAVAGGGGSSAAAGGSSGSSLGGSSAAAGGSSGSSSANSSATKPAQPISDGAGATLPAEEVLEAPGDSQTVEEVTNPFQEEMGDNPSAAALRIKDSLCSAVVVDANWLLTAAHCVLENKESKTPYALDDIQAIIGQKNIASPSYTSVDEVIVHPAYTARTKEFDVALLRLSEPTDAPAMVIANEDDKVNWKAGTTAEVAGWGLPCKGCEASSTITVKKVTIEEQDVCQSAYNNSKPQMAITANMICAKAVEREACTGDSGGPMSVDVAGEDRLVGLVSFGVGCNNPKYPGVYTYLPSVSLWVGGYVVENLSAPKTIKIQKAKKKKIKVKAMTLKNSSNFPVAISALALEGSKKLTLRKGTCKDFLAAGQTCQVRVAFQGKGRKARGKLSVVGVRKSLAEVSLQATSLKKAKRPKR